MINTNIFKRIFKNRKSTALTKYQFVTERGNGTYIWNGKIYESDIVRACVAPYVKAVGKLVGKHIFDSLTGVKVNPEFYMKKLLENPNPLMSAQKFQEKLAAQLLLNRNSFAVIVRDKNGLPTEIFPLSTIGVEAIYKSSELFLKFTLENGKTYTYNYDDVIHLRMDFCDNDIFGNPLMPTLAPLLKIVGTIDDGIVSAVKNSNAIKWLLKFTQSLRPEDVKISAEKFSKTYLETSSSGSGVAATDAKADIQQIKPNDYVPNFEILNSVNSRIYSLFGVSENIVKGNYTEDEWNSFYESSIEPIAIDMANEYTRKLFSVKKCSYGNRIIFEAGNLNYATISTKLNFLQMVDRGALTPNEWRGIFNLAPVEGGDEPIRRLDTRPTSGLLYSLPYFTSRRRTASRFVGTAALTLSQRVPQRYYINLLTSGRLNAYLVKIDKQAQKRFERLIEGMKQTQGITEQLKAENAFEWIGRINNILACAREIVNEEIIFA